MKVYAHRGVVGRNADENSLEAIRRAVALGVDGIEVDIRRTRDDEAVLVHDTDLRRIAGDIRQVADLSLDELKDITLRHGTRVIALDELTANVPSPIELNLEVKDKEAMDLMIRKLRTSSGLRERTIISSFSQEVIEQAFHELPEVRRVLLFATWPTRFRFFSEWAKAHALYGIEIMARQWTLRRVEQAHEVGLLALTYERFGTRSTKSRAERLVAMGVDIAIVNQPEAYLR